MLPAQTHHFPTSFALLTRVLIWSATALIPALGGLRSYRRYYGLFAKQSSEADQIRDELVFDDDRDKLGHVRRSAPLPSERSRPESK